jgi:hypothetical protein
VKGPVQVLVVGFDHPTFSGEVLAEFTRLRNAGIVRLVDLLLVSRTADGTLETLTAPDGIDAGLGGLAVALFAQRDGGGSDPAAGAEAWSLTDVIPVGTAAAVALVEHLWAGPLTAAIRRAGSSRSAETWLAPDDLDLLDALIEQRAMSQPSAS